MSHIVTLKVNCRDAMAVRAACQRLGLAAPVEGTVELFSGRARGLAVQLPGWHFPVVCNTTTGQVQFDNFGGRWGDERELDRFLHAYAAERVKIEARKKGLLCTEQALADGSLKLTLQASGGTT